MIHKFFIFLGITLLSITSLQAQKLSLSWASYYGGAHTRVTAIQYDTISHTFYICGVTSDSTGIATPGSHKSYFGAYDSLTAAYPIETFIARFDAAGNRLWATYFGGQSEEPTLAIDPAGNIYISGNTRSPMGIATPGGFYNNVDSLQSFIPSLVFQYIAKFNPQGQQIWGTYYSMPVPTIPITASQNTISTSYRIAFDAEANLYMTSGTSIQNGIATSGCYQAQNDTSKLILPGVPIQYCPYLLDAFLVKFDSSGNRLWGTYYGGNAYEYGTCVYAQPTGSVYIAGAISGNTDATQENYPYNIFVSPGAFIDSITTLGNTHGFLAKFDSSGNRLWGTLIGGAGTFEQILNIKGDAFGNLYVYGITNDSLHYGTPGTYKPEITGSGSDAFLLKFNANGKRIWGTYFGGSGNEDMINSDTTFLSLSNLSLVITNDAVYLSGKTNSIDSIATPCTYSPQQGMGGYIAKFDTAGHLLMSSYYDAPVSDISLDGNDNIYFASWSKLDNLATSGSFLDNKPSGENAGIFGVFTQDYICPLDTVHLSVVGNELVADSGYLVYKWYQNDILIDSGTNFHITINQDASYHVVVTANCDCQYVSDKVIVSTSGINELSNNGHVTLAPNPASSFLNLDIKGYQYTNPVCFQIRDLMGRAIENGVLNFVNSNKASIDISHLNEGVYLLHLNAANLHQLVKFVKISGK